VKKIPQIFQIILRTWIINFGGGRWRGRGEGQGTDRTEDSIEEGERARRREIEGERR
jgi:hypothetical protein